MYSEQEKAIARQIVQDEGIKNLLAKVFTTKNDSLNHDVVMEKTNEELGEIVRADALAEEKVIARWRSLVALGTKTATKEPTKVPE